jgi:hypothetical protein
VCTRFPHVFNPATSLRRGYVDVQRYSDIIDALGEKFKCTPVVFRKKTFFSIARLGMKTIAQIEDCNQLQLGDNFAILDNNEGCRFFCGEPAVPTMRVTPNIEPQDVGTKFVETPPPYTTASPSYETACLMPKELPTISTCASLAA